MPKVGDPIPGTNLFYEESDIANLGNEVSVLGSSLAIPDKLKADQTLAMLTGNIRGGQYQNLQGQTIDAKTGQPVIPPEESAKTPEDPTLQDFIEYITPDGQTATIYQPEMNRGAIELLLKQGAKPLKFLISRPLAFDYGYGAPAAFPSENAAQTALNDAKNELDSLKKQFDSYRISDADLQNQISSISAGWDARIAQMENINKRREASLNTLGIRLGSRWTGGQFGEVVAEEERQGIARIGELEAQKQSAIQTAKKAARDQNWEIYVKQVDLAEKQYEKQQDAVRELNKLQAEQTKKLMEESKKSSRQAAIGDVITQMRDIGRELDPTEIYSALNYDENGKMTGDITFKEITDITNALKTKPEDTRPTAQKEFEYYQSLSPDDKKAYDAFKNITDNPQISASERMAATIKYAIRAARKALENSAGEDGYVDPAVYTELRSNYAEAIGDIAEFDNAFALLLSPNERARLGVGKAQGVKALEEEDDLF